MSQKSVQLVIQVWVNSDIDGTLDYFVCIKH